MLSLRQRLAHDEGFTLIELLVVLIIIGILLTIAIPSYLGFQKKAQQTAAASDVRQAIPDAEAYYSDHNSYAPGGTSFGVADLKGYDNGLQVYSATNPGILTVKASSAADGTTAAGQEYCISAEDSGNFAWVAGPGGVVRSGLTTDPCTAWTHGVS